MTNISKENQFELLNEFFENKVLESNFEYPGYVTATLNNGNYVIFNDQNLIPAFEIYTCFEKYNEGANYVDYKYVNM